jgi:hypothetical protein
MGPSPLDTDTSFANGRFNVPWVVLPEIERMFRQVQLGALFEKKP